MLLAVSPSFTKATIVTSFHLEGKFTPSYDSSYYSVKGIPTVWSPFCDKGLIAVLLPDLDVPLLRPSLFEILKAISPITKSTSYHHHQALLTTPNHTPNSILIGSVSRPGTSHEQILTINPADHHRAYATLLPPLLKRPHTPPFSLPHR